MTFKDIGIGVAIGIAIYLMLNGVNLWPLLLVAGLLYFLFLTNPSFSHRRYATVVGPSTCSAITFDDVGGLAPVKQELKEALDFLTDPEEAIKMGIRPLKGIILSGPPGTGKTLLAKAAANYTDSAFLATSGSEFVEVYAGVGAQRVRLLFKNAREAARKSKKKSAIVFIDEMEVLGGWRGKNVGHLEYDQTLNQFPVT